jgi:peptide/nickel transport system substrate-binding protein
MNFRLRVVTLAAAAVIVAAGLSACTSSTAAPASGGSAAAATNPLLRVGINYTVTTLDPAKNGYQFEIAPLIMETLLKMGPRGQLEPDLATSVSNPNPVTYVYYLRRGVKFWDGTELTSADVVYSWNYERAAGSDNASYFSSVKAIAADGPSTVVVTLAHPDASWQCLSGAGRDRHRASGSCSSVTWPAGSFSSQWW